jgi:phosphatidylglycerol:prolipoprotein diacylglycerol transferase
MLPIVGSFELFGFERPIGGYGLAVALGVLVTGTLVGRVAYRSKLDVGAVIATLGYTTGAAFGGSFLLFLIVEALRTGDPGAGLRTGGLVFYGAVPTGALVSWIAARGFQLPYLRILDLCAPAIAAGHALGRLGCFLGGCCFGAEWHGPWAVTFTHAMAPAAHPMVPRHPTQLYEAAGLMVLAFVFALAPVRRVGDGRRILAYAMSYAVLRFFVETMRGDAVRGIAWNALSTSQIVSIALFVFGLAFYVRQTRRAPSAPASAA